MPAGFARIPGLKIGHAQDERALTGCTVLLSERGMVAACEVRGGAVGERELETLRPGHLVERIHAVVFAGGSAYGLEAASGVMRWLEERGAGFDVGQGLRVPIVSSAVVFDLRLGDPKRRPDQAMGRAAAEAAAEGPIAEGNVGAGTGASVGKLFGIRRATKAGVGCWSEEVRGEKESAVVAALAVVNAFGDVREPDSGRIVAGARTAEDSAEFAGMAAEMLKGRVRKGFAGPNTVLVAVATTARLDRLGAQRLAGMASAGVARAVSPAHTTFDGDVVFALSLGEMQAGPSTPLGISPGGSDAANAAQDLNALGAAAAEAVARAIVRAATEARAAGGLPAAANLAQPGRQ